MKNGIVKHSLFLVIICLSFIACKKDKPSTIDLSNDNSISIKKTENPIQFVCDGFFEKGDYSSICFVTTKTPVYKQDETSVSSICIYRVGKRPNTSNDDYVSVSFQKLTSTSLTKPVFRGLKKDAKGTVVDINGLGDEAYMTTYLTQDKYKEKNIHVRYNNLIVSFHVIYEKNNTEPCSYSNSELQKFAGIVIRNI